MKVSTIILLATFVLLVTAMFASNVLLKKEYGKVDKSDLYWTYGKILEQPFKHLKIEGGNITSIAFEPGKTSSVRVFKNWEGYENGSVKAFVKNDTLFVKFPDAFKNQGEKQWLKYITSVRIFSPELLSVDGFNTNLGLFKLRQKSLHVSLSGKSKFEVESYISDLDTLTISQKDSSEVVFEMSPDLATANPFSVNANKPNEPVMMKAGISDAMQTPAPLRKGWETMNVKFVEASIKDNSLLDIGHAQIKSLKLDVADSSGIILSGATLKTIRK